MITFENEYKNFRQRLFSFDNFGYVAVFIFYSCLLFNLKLFNSYTIIIELILFVIFSIMIIKRSKSNIDLISIDEKNIVLNGETYNTKWKKSLNIKETYIQIQHNASRRGLCSETFYLNIKCKKDNYIINSFDTFSDEGILLIFNEFKNRKGEKIIIDEKLVLSRIQEKIEKCQ